MCKAVVKGLRFTRAETEQITDTRSFFTHRCKPKPIMNYIDLLTDVDRNPLSAHEHLCLHISVAEVNAREACICKWENCRCIETALNSAIKTNSQRLYATQPDSHDDKQQWRGLLSVNVIHLPYTHTGSNSCRPKQPLLFSCVALRNINRFELEFKTIIIPDGMSKLRI